MYYLNVQARVWFSRLCLLRRAILCAATTTQRTSIADALIYQWTEKFDHPIKIIDVARAAHPWPDFTSLHNELDAMNNMVPDDLH